MNRLCKVLIADDEKPVAAGLQGQLDALGYDVVAVVDDGHHAIDVCRRTLPDVVLMDIEMPGLDGLSAARQIAQRPGHARHHPDRSRPSQPDRPGRRGRRRPLPAQARDQPEPPRRHPGRRRPGARDPRRCATTSTPWR